MAVTHEEVTLQGDENGNGAVEQQPAKRRRRAFVAGGVAAVAAVLAGAGGTVAAMTSSHNSNSVTYKLSADACNNLGPKTFDPAAAANWQLYPNTDCNTQSRFPAASGVLLEGDWWAPGAAAPRIDVVVENDATAAKYTVQQQEAGCDDSPCTTWWYGGFDTQSQHYGTVVKGTLSTPDGAFPDEVATNARVAGWGENSYMVQVPGANGQKLDVIVGIDNDVSPSKSYEQVAANAVAAVLAPAS
jgi:predicted ribosomally synthesized peptide with SipW-like signal peptide